MSKKHSMCNKAAGEIALDYASRIVELLNGENPEQPQSVVVTAAAYPEGIQLEVFQFSFPDAVADLAQFLKDTTFTEDTEDYRLDEEEENRGGV